MIFSCHRINTIKQLKKIPMNFGIEVDINRDFNNLKLKHDPFEKGESFERFLQYYKNKFIILNVKSEGLEEKIFNIMKKKKINNFFFLDSSFPFIYKLSKSLTKNFAIRISDIESFQTVLRMKNKVKWIWIDCFKNYNISIKNIKLIKKLNFKICLVTPDLHKRKLNKKDKIFYKKIETNNIKIDMICAKKRNYKKYVNYFPSLLNLT